MLGSLSGWGARRRGLRRGSAVAGMLVTLACAVAGCGAASSGSAPSALDPAAAAPPTAALFFDLTVRPQGAQRSAAIASLTALIGPQASSDVETMIAKLTAKSGVSYRHDVAPWLGQRIGIVLSRVPQPGTNPTADVALIAPTSDPSAAKSFVAHQLRRSATSGLSGTVIGHDAIVGGAVAYPEVVTAAGGRSLADSAAYRSATSRLGPGSVASMWINTRQLDRLVLNSARARQSGLASLLRRELPSTRTAGDLVAGLFLTTKTIRLREIVVGAPKATASAEETANVGTLPSASWLALSDGHAQIPAAVRQSLTLGLAAGLASAAARAGATGSAAARSAEQQIQQLGATVTSALGPFSLAVAGTSPLDISFGFSLKPATQSAGRRLFATIEGFAERAHRVSGTPTQTGFSIGLPTGRSLTVSDAHGRLTALYGFSSLGALLSPTSRLSGNATYTAARAQLPGDDSVPAYVAFAPIDALVSLAGDSPSAAKVERELGRLNYLIAGTHDGVTDVVLGLR